MTKTHQNTTFLAAEERTLIEQIKRRVPGWEDLFGELIAGHHMAIQRRCLGYLKNADDAADATQETLLRAYRAIHRFRGEAQLRTWLLSIADNECHSLARKRARYIAEPDMSRVLWEHLGDAAIERLPEPDDSELLQGAMQKIGLKDREVLQLRYFADLPINQVAVTLGLGLSATKMRLYRAQAQLATVLAPERLPLAA